MIEEEPTVIINSLYKQELRSDEVHEIITAVPSWIIRWGVSLVFASLGCIILLSAFINYPDVVKTTLKINSLNAPKSVLAYQSGKLTKLLIKEGDAVKQGQNLGFLESIANPMDVLAISENLRNIRKEMVENRFTGQFTFPTNLNLGELQGAYQNFYQEYLQYQGTQNNGYYVNRLAFLKKELLDVRALKNQILKQRDIQNQEYTNAEEEFKRYKTLFQNKVISRSEFVSQENKYLAAKYPLQQTETSLLNNSSSYSGKEKELLELEHTILEQQSKFVQALNQCITETDGWILKHVLRAPTDGKVSFAGIIQQNQNVQANQEIFIVNAGNTDFFGEIQIPQYNMGKIRLGEKVLVKLRSYPFEQYGMIRGDLSYISEAAYRDSVFIAKVNFVHFENKDPSRKIVIKNGMLADAEIITEESSLLQRFFRNITKMLNGSS